MEQLQIEAVVREPATPSAIRRSGMIPAIMYGRDLEPVELQVDYRQFEKALGHGARSRVINLLVGAAGDSYPVMLKEVQYDPRKGHIIHADFHKISLKEKVHTRVPVLVVGGDEVEKRGGIVQHQLREIEVECLPTNIPARFTANISTLEIGHHISISDIQFPEGVKPVDEPDVVVVTIVAPRRVEEEEVAAPAEEAAAPAAGEKAPEKAPEKGSEKAPTKE
ncbi:MAG: 50S ribosomal protein L25 [Bacillota bacterium]|nr:50S ribosomal protein L25 [Bacillota bacterium]